MLLLCGGELMGAGGGIQHVVIIVVGFGIQRGLQAGKTRVRNGRGRQTHVKVGVVGAVQTGVDVVGHAVLRVDDGGVDVQQGGVVPVE